MKIHSDVKLDYSDVMLLPKCGVKDAPQSRSEVNLFNDDGFVPIIAANMDGVGTFEMAIQLSKYDTLTALHKHYSVDELVDFYCNNPTVAPYTIYSMGTNDWDKFSLFTEMFRQSSFQWPFAVCVDVANAYTKSTHDFVRKLRENYTGIIIAGNVVTREGVASLANAGADIIKVGIGPGSVCTTRRLTGIGYPQFSAVIECADQAHNYEADIKIIADGGITCPGDVAKALAAGADYVMLGGVFAGHDEGGGEVAGTSMKLGGPEFRRFYGMASKPAQDKHNGGVAEYRASEGKEVLIPYKGPVSNTIKEYLGGLRSTCAYMGVKDLSKISINPEFIKVNRQLNQVFGA